MYSTPLNDLAWRPPYAVTVWGKTPNPEEMQNRGPKTVLTFFYKSVATDPGTVATDWRHLGCNPLTTFPGTVELEAAKIQIPGFPYKHYDEKLEFHLDPLQQFLGTLPTDPTQIHSNPITMAPP